MALKRWPLFIAWDGMLPFLVAGSLDLIRFFLGRGDAAELLAIIVIPMIAALLRCAAGIEQLRRMGIRHPGGTRQILLAAAIIVLMLFEGLANAIRAIGGALPTTATVIAFTFYGIYLLLVWLTFRPPRTTAPTRVASIS